jgi:hypothetical protein
MTNFHTKVVFGVIFGVLFDTEVIRFLIPHKFKCLAFLGLFDAFCSLILEIIPIKRK